MKITVKEVAAMVDHTNLKAFATREDFQKLCNEAVHYGFKSVAINTYPVAMCREMLRGTNVLTGAAISFPLGQTTIATKVAEARNAVADGCQEFDYVLNVGKVKEHDYDYIEEEMRQMVAVAREAGICAKVIFETCYLTEEEIIEVAKDRGRCDEAGDIQWNQNCGGDEGSGAAGVRLMPPVDRSRALSKVLRTMRSAARKPRRS